MSNKLLPYWQDMKNDSVVCHILDPRLKYQFLEDRSDKTKGTKTLEGLYKTYSSMFENSPQNSQNSVETKKKSQSRLSNRCLQQMPMM